MLQHTHFDNKIQADKIIIIVQIIYYNRININTV